MASDKAKKDANHTKRGKWVFLCSKDSCLYSRVLFSMHKERGVRLGGKKKETGFSATGLSSFETQASTI